MNPGFRPVPSSVIAEWTGIWNSAGDRDFAFAVAYVRLCLARAGGRPGEPLVEWCLEYCRRQLTPDGVVASDSDELEGRFPAGDANLCTSSLYYDALLSSMLT